jgi:RNA polymerase sigma-70 factor (ECF subfamily)
LIAFEDRIIIASPTSANHRSFFPPNIVELSDSLAGLPQRLDALTTRWSLVRRAHGASVASSNQARSELVLRYAAAIRSYVRAIVRDNSQGDELAQDAVVRLLSGDFGGADPARGRFRDLLKTAVRNMVRNHWAKENRRRAVVLDVNQIEGNTYEEEIAWVSGWRQNALDLAWSALEAFERLQPKSSAFTVLRLRAAFPEASSDDLAAKLSDYSGQHTSAEAARQKLRRARVKFAELLIEEIADCLDDASPDAIEAELQSLELFEYVRDLLPPDWKQRRSATNSD